MVNNNFKNVVKQVQNLLKENTEWKERYSSYATAIEANLPIINEERKNFNQFNPLRFYITTSCLKDKKAVFSVRYLGQEVAKLSVKGENIKLSTNGYEKNNAEHFGCNISVNNEDWTGKCASDFRKYFLNHYKNNIKRNNERKRNEEHRIESLLLAEFSKRSSKNKSLTGIQPVKIANACFPMPTPISASNHNGIKYSGSGGGGIDIFARVGKHPTKLCVIEVKDETVSKEPPSKATEQAVAYATFIRELLRQDPTWYKLFGFSGKVPKSLTILASCAMPYNKDLYDTSFDGQIIDIDDNDKIELHYIYFEENNNTITKIDSSINKKNIKGAIMSKLIIHRGTQEIGGSAVEINNGETRLLFDFGVPLDSMVKDEWQPEDYKLPISGLYSDVAPKFNAVFLTHAHPDHYGLMQMINSKIPIYVSKVTYDVLTQIAPLLPKQNTTNLNLHVIDGELDFGNIKVKAHKVDHSIAGATAYEIETEGKTIVYSGDIRFHGRASWQSSVFKRKINNPDYLIMEGTTLGRAEQDIVKEEDLEKEFVKIFKNGKLPMVQFSPQNIDRFVTVFKACKRTGKILVIDPYTAYVLEVYSSMSDSIPQFHWGNIMVNFAHSSINHKLAEEKILFKYKDKKITTEEIVANPEKFVIKGNWAINKQIFDAIEHDKLEIVFSMWKGYLDRPNQFDDYKDVKLTPLHTSGHAYIEDLQKLVEKMHPKHLIPIHTECKDKYRELFNSNIITLNDGEELII